MTKLKDGMGRVLLATLMIAGPLAGAQTPATNSVVPTLVNFSGTLTDVNGKAVSGIAGVTFYLYKDAEGGAPLWLETQNVQPDRFGHYTVVLGSATSQGLPSNLFTSGEARWLGVQPQGQEEQPRIMLMSVPYALKAGDAQTVGGLPASAFVLNASPAGGASPNGSNAGQGGAQPNVGGSGTQNYISLWTDNNGDLGNSAIYQSGTAKKPKIGIGTTTPASTLDVKGGATVRGLFDLPASGTANASQGFTSQPMEVTASVFNTGAGSAVTQNFQWQAEPVGNNTNNTTGTLNLLFGTGNSKLGETGLNIASNGQITFASGQTFPGTGTVTSVGTGLGLKGGPILNSGTLTIDTTVVPQLNVANIFTATQTISSGDVSLRAGNIDLPQTVSNTVGSLTLGGTPFLHACCSAKAANTFVGSGAGNFTTTGTVNTAVGYSALSSNTAGALNTAVGYEALYSNTGASANTAIGQDALYANTSGQYNTANGQDALAANSTGNGNTASGNGAMANSTTGSANAASGYEALVQNTTGTGNSGVGYNSGAGNKTGSYNTFLGYAAATSADGFTNATAIGADAEVSANNALVLGSIAGVNGATSNTSVGIGTTSPQATLDVHGTGNFTGLITFASGQTFPGTGTITAVNAGTGLSGGGTSGNVTLNNTGILSLTQGTGISISSGQTPTIGINTSVVPELSSNNTFTGSNSFSSTTGNGISATTSAAGDSGVFASNSNTSAGYGVFASAYSPGGDALAGFNYAASGNAIGVYGSSSSSTGTGVYGAGKSYGVYGQSGSGNGVYGLSTNNTGVIGQSNATSGTANGVYGSTTSPAGTGTVGVNLSTGGYGVYGQSSGTTSGSTGVYGTATNSSATAATYGVYGVTSSGAKGSSGVYGVATASPFDVPVYGVYGVSSDYAFGAAVAGTGSTLSGTGSGYSGGGFGVWGDASPSGCCGGVLGTADDSDAVVAINRSGTDTGTPALYAANNTAATGALVFETESSLGGSCTIDVSGNLGCTGSIGARAAAGGHQVELYGVASPKNWFEDFGSGQLSSGSATVTIDPEYGQTVNTEVEYRVFLTPNGDCKGLYISHRTPTSFEVRELGGGTSSIEFSYRIVALRKNYENIRLEDHTNDPDPMKRMKQMLEHRGATAGPPTQERMEFPARIPTAAAVHAAMKPAAQK